MVDRKPNLAAYARVSYFRELHGDLDGALAADARGRVGRRRGARAGRLRARAARRARAAEGPHRRRRAPVPRGAAGRARLPGRRGRPGPGRRRARAPARRPSRGCSASSIGCRCPSYVIALGEAQAAAGRRAARGADLRARARRDDAAAARRRQRRRRARALRGRPRQRRAGPWLSAAEPGRRLRAFARPTPWGGPCIAQGTRAPRSGGRGARWPSARATRPS